MSINYVHPKRSVKLKKGESVNLTQLAAAQSK